MATRRDFRIGVISDTHDRWNPRVGELFQDVDEIWHLGDVCREDILDELRVINPKLTVVLGNNDHDLREPLTVDLVRGGERFRLIHILPRHIRTDTDWILYGHTHRPADEMHEGVHLFNPGSAGRANKGAPVSLGFLTKSGTGKFRCETVLL